jgi:hypothetical protein
MLYFLTKYICCVYPSMSKSPKQLPNCLKLSFSSLLILSSEVCTILLPFLTIDQHESGIGKLIFLSVTVYSKKNSSQSNLAAQIEPIQDN